MSERLDRIEKILEELAEQQKQGSQRMISIERTIQAMLEQRVTDRFEHQEQITRLEKVAERLANVQLGMSRWLTNIDET